MALFERDGSLWVGLQAGALFCAEFVCIYLGLQHISASRLTVFLYTAPFWVAAVLPLLVASERLRAPQWLGLALGLTATQYGLAAGLFYLGYIAVEVPSNLIQTRVGARLWIPRIMISWGLVCMATAWVTGANSFYAARILLGAAFNHWVAFPFMMFFCPPRLIWYMGWPTFNCSSDFAL